MKIRFEAELEAATQFVLKMPEKLDEYARNLLVIVNNARTYPRDFLKVENNDGDLVYVTCNEESKESVREFLEYQGTIKDERKVLICRPEYVYSKQTAEYIDNLYESEDAPWDIVTLAPEEL